ncbi:MAG: GNAT family N-acetyltransferase [Clostridiales bacterium]|nr:GNAT family N-acetyltransferase [Clostridiales bacterium]
MYKLYSTGREFLDENQNIIRNDPLGAMFLAVNANMIEQCDETNYAVRVEVDGSLLLAIHVGDYPLVLYGSEGCVDEFAQVVTKNKLQFNRTIGPYDISDLFLQAYERIVGGSHKVNLSMDVMYCDKVNPCDTANVEQATLHDADEITRLYTDFLNEALGENATWGEKKRQITQEIDDFALLRVGDEIVSIASSKNSGQGLKRISNVYTKPQHRNNGYSRKVVTYLTERALQSGNLPCLHVDQNNPVSNHLYLSIGYKYGKSRYEFIYIPHNN